MQQSWFNIFRIPRHLAFFTPGWKQDTGFTINQNQIILPQRNMDFAQRARWVLNWESWVPYPEVGTHSQAWEVLKPGVSLGEHLLLSPVSTPSNVPSGPMYFSHVPRQQMQSPMLEWSLPRIGRKQPLLPVLGGLTLTVLRHHGGVPMSAGWRRLCSRIWICSEHVSILSAVSKSTTPHWLPRPLPFLEMFLLFLSWQLYSESKESCDPEQAGWEGD